MSQTTNYFIPSIRQGFATAIKEKSSNSRHRAKIDVILTAEAQRKHSSDEFDSEPVSQTIYLYGPGDIIGFHDRVVSRKYPQENVGDSEHNYFPLIEFSDPDFVWRYTTDKAEEGNGKLTPWLTLIVLVAENQNEKIQVEYEKVTSDYRNLPSAIKVYDNANLPNLKYAWLWAHAHISNIAGKEKEYLTKLIKKDPGKAICRLLCPRKLYPGVKYCAFVVPTFEISRRAGRGESFGNTPATEFAWDKSESREVELPYYYSWEFRTGMRGDFEHLVRLLEPRELLDLGLKKINCSKPGFGVAPVDRGFISHSERSILEMEGALQSLDTEYTEWGRDPYDQNFQGKRPLQRDLAELLNKYQADQSFNKINLTVNPSGIINSINVIIPPTGLVATIRWNTTENAKTNLVYDEAEPRDENNSMKISGNTFKNDHEVHLELKPGITYYFKIKAQTATGTISKTPLNSFTMPPIPFVLPPIYGRWHKGVDKVNPNSQDNLLDILNLDPRHRAVAGYGSKVIRKLQELLMASAWDQLGAIESANDILRRAQFGRQALLPLYHRLEDLPIEKFVQVTAPLQKRIVLKDREEPNKTVSYLFNSKTKLPKGALDTSFRRITRKRGPIRKKQNLAQSGDILNKLAKGTFEAAGPAPKPLGTLGMCDITRTLEKSLKPNIIEFTGYVTFEGTEATVTLSWSTENATNCIATSKLPFWNGNVDLRGDNEAVGTFIMPSQGNGNGPHLPSESGLQNYTGGSVTLALPLASISFTLTCLGPTGNDSAKLVLQLPNTTGNTPLIVTKLESSESVIIDLLPVGETGDSSSPAYGTEIDDNVTFNPRTSVSFINNPVVFDFSSLTLRFCDEEFTCQHVSASINENSSFKGIGNVPDPEETRQIVCNVLKDWLNKETSGREKKVDTQFINDLKNKILTTLDPNVTVPDRTKKRLRLSPELAARSGDPLEPIMYAPYFPQPMYEPLRDISHDLLLPGVEKIPHNTIGLLKTNRRFLESYMMSLSDRFVGELLWRGYPTDQRGTYFQQFWDVSGYVLRPEEIEALLNGLSDREISHQIELNLDLAFDLLREKWLRKENVSQVDQLPGDKKDIISKIQRCGVKAIPDIPQLDRDYLAARILKEEELKDIKPIIRWQDNKLGESSKKDLNKDENIVFVIRGDLLKRYPNALIYAVEGVRQNGQDGDIRPGLSEFLNGGIEHGQRIFPLFKATLPPDLTFIGFPFSNANGKYFVIEEQVSEPRFGLDIESATLDTWDDLSWSHFFDDENSTGSYLDDSPSENPEPTNNNDGWHWNENISSSAIRACITMQKPVRIAIHADELLPKAI